MSFENDLARGLADVLTGIGTWLDGDTPAVAITYRTIPDSPDRVITLSPYAVTDHVSLSSSAIAVQVRIRGLPDDADSCDTIADAIFDRLHGAQHLDLSTGIHLSQLYRQSSGSLGQDGNRRWARADNYYCDAHRPSTHRT